MKINVVEVDVQNLTIRDVYGLPKEKIQSYVDMIFVKEQLLNCGWDKVVQNPSCLIVYKKQSSL